MINLGKYINRLRMKPWPVLAVVVVSALVLGGGYLLYIKARGEMYVVEKYTGFKSQINKVWFSSDTEEVGAISTLGVWNWQRSNGRLVKHLNVQYAKAINEEAGVVLATGPYSSLACWDILSESKIHVWDKLDGEVGPTVFLPDDKQFLVGTGYNLLKGKPELHSGTYDIELFDLDTFGIIRSFEGHFAAASSLHLIPGKPQFLSAGDDGTLRLWDLRTGKELQIAGTPTGPKTLERNGRRILAPFDHLRDRQRVSSVSPDGKVAVWNSTLWAIRQWREYKQLVRPTREERILCSDFSPDGRRLATGHEDGSVRLWDMSTLSEICRVYGHKNYAPVLAVAFSPDGNYLLTGGRGTIPGFNAMASGLKASDLVVRLWKLPEME